jgi:hypothetical protein
MLSAVRAVHLTHPGYVMSSTNHVFVRHLDLKLEVVTHEGTRALALVQPGKPDVTEGGLVEATAER